MKRCGLCRKVKFRLPHAVKYTYVDGDGMPVEDHMKICKKCGEELDNYAKDRKKDPRV